jgi:general secretion pathway protein D
VNNRGTIVIGGLIEEQQDFSKDSVPCLGGLPALGWAFKTAGTSETKTNLLVFLSPTVYESPEEVSPETIQKKEYMEKERNKQQRETEKELPPFMKFKPFDGTQKEETNP